jgi:hypothetical protein
MPCRSTKYPKISFHPSKERKTRKAEKAKRVFKRTFKTKQNRRKPNKQTKKQIHNKMFKKSSDC